jgi:hypothetical protein
MMETAASISTGLLPMGYLGNFSLLANNGGHSKDKNLLSNQMKALTNLPS